jgi:hypothetical protein
LSYIEIEIDSYLEIEIKIFLLGRCLRNQIFEISWRSVHSCLRLAVQRAPGKIADIVMESK